MSTLHEKSIELANLASAVEDGARVGHASAALAEVQAQVDGFRERLEGALAVLSEAELPAIDEIEQSRVENTVDLCKKVSERVRSNPVTVNEGKTWANLQRAAKALTKDLRALSATRWRELVDSESTEDAESFIETVAPGALGLDEFKRHLDTLKECRDLDVPEPGSAAKARRAIEGIRRGQEELKAHAVPEGIREKYAELVQGTLPLAEFDGAVSDFVESQGFSEHLRLRLDPVERA